MGGQGDSQQKLKFDHTNKWYMHNPESVLENDHLISARRPDAVRVNNKREPVE